MQLLLHHPEDGFYQGTRFDRSGVWDSLLCDGTELCGRWFTRYDPFLHDAVQGPAEEFSPVMSGPDLSSLAVKIGVGLLQLDSQPYDRFKLYPVADPGVWTVEQARDCVQFRHVLRDVYLYEKEIALTGEASFVIRHRLQALIPLVGEVYNHNFFTMGKMAVSPSRLIDFPFAPEGHWRAAYDSVAFTSGGIRFSRSLREGESVYTGDIHKASEEGMPYEMSLREGPFSVKIKGDVPVSRTVLWANHRVACLEPYNALDVGPGKTFTWKIDYTLI